MLEKSTVGLLDFSLEFGIGLTGPEAMRGMLLGVLETLVLESAGLEKDVFETLDLAGFETPVLESAGLEKDVFETPILECAGFDSPFFFRHPSILIPRMMLSIVCDSSDP